MERQYLSDIYNNPPHPHLPVVLRLLLPRGAQLPAEEVLLLLLLLLLLPLVASPLLVQLEGQVPRVEEQEQCCGQ